MSNLRLPFESADARDSRIEARDRDGRARAVDPRHNVALEASAGTGKTRVLVDRYINLLKAGVAPSNILAMTFTRKAAAEMRQRIIATLQAAAATGEIPAARWRELRDRTADIAISTIDAFCLSILREFPLEADLDPGFSLADETEAPRLVDESLDRTLRICRNLAREDENVALVFAQIGERRVRRGLAALINRRLVAPAVLSKFLTRGPADMTVTSTTGKAAARLLGVVAAMRGGLDGFIHSGPIQPAFLVLAQNLRGLAAALDEERQPDPAAVQTAYVRVREHFLTHDGEPRKQLAYAKTLFPSEHAWREHRAAVIDHAADVVRASEAFRHDLNVLVARGTLRMYSVAEREYRHTLDAHAVLDFPDVLLRTIELLRHMDEFAQSRFRLESRYHHVLLDEFQDTSRAQWELVSLLVQSWGEGAGLAYSGPLPPSIFIVGDRKQSIYGFRDADVSLLSEAARHLEGLRANGDVRRSISKSFRSVPSILSFINDVCRDIEKATERNDAFLYDEPDQFPLASTGSFDAALGLVCGATPDACAEQVAAEIERLVEAQATVRDRESGVHRAIKAGDVAILFRTRESHREFESALERRGIAAYVYKGLGFFDTEEVKDVLALLWYLADPHSDLRAAAVMRSRIVRLSDEALRLLGPRLAAALSADVEPESAGRLDEVDREMLADARRRFRGWRDLVDHVSPAELLDHVLTDTAYAVEMRGPRFQQARENLKKLRGLVRRIQNRGYTTVARLAAHLDHLAVGDDSNASIDARDAVSLMTVHASKGLEFPVVFLVNLSRGTARRRDPIRVGTDGGDEETTVSIGDFQSAADDDQSAREQEETKRLLYVAMTRARDRLYLGAVLKDGAMQPGRGSLAEVLPPTLLELFSAAGGGSTIDWRASSGTIHRFGVCTPTPDDALDGARNSGESVISEMAGAAYDVTRIAATGTPRVTVADALEQRPAGISPDAHRSDRVIGTVVHRLLQRLGVRDDASDATSLAHRLLRADEASGVDDPASAVETAVTFYRALCAHPEIRALYRTGRSFHEVPFTMVWRGTHLRGTIDCLVHTAPDAVTVLEFKTGSRRPEHAEQLELYRAAASQIFPDFVVTGRLVYAGDVLAS